jgi:isoaspartyl peptidase/L-asparaginase-like protein (Ntn-hydrolase superfamily)
MKLVLSKQVCDLMGQGFSAQLACQSAIQLLQERMGEKGKGGVIGLDKTGRVGFFFNTAAMPYAFVVGEEEITAGR